MSLINGQTPASSIGKLLTERSKSYCLAKWYQSTMFLHTGQTSGCHHVKRVRINKKKLRAKPSEIHNTTGQKVDRFLMLKGVRPKSCQFCWSVENCGHQSDRYYKSEQDWAIRNYGTDAAKSFTSDVLPSNIEVIFSNKCNLSCSYCNPISSSRWLKEQEELGDFPTDFNPYRKWKLRVLGPKIYKEGEPNPFKDAFWKWWPEVSKNIEVLRISGGEPLLISDSWRVIRSLGSSKLSHIFFEMNSNFSVSKPIVDKFIDELGVLSGQIKGFNLYVSLDSVGEQAEYIRHGLNFKLFKRNVMEYLERSPREFQLTFMITVCALSVFKCEELLKYIYELKQKYPDRKINIDTPFLKKPEYLSLKILTKDHLENLDRALLFIESTVGCNQGFKVSEVERLKRVLVWAKEADCSRLERRFYQNNFIRFIKHHDQVRGTDFNKVFPELKGVCQGWKRAWIGSLGESIAYRTLQIYKIIRKPLAF